MPVQPWLIALLWITWLLPFILFRPRRKGEIVQKAPTAKWGILCQTIGYWGLYIPFRGAWIRPLAMSRIALGVVLTLCATGLAAAAIRHLGKQWRVAAALNADHQLVRTGPYQFVRHPIYASMLLMFLMSIVLMGTMPVWPFALVFFLIGLEIRVRTEDTLLRSRFGSEFETWRASVPAYLPALR